jgi:hypothetical protein
MLFKSHWQRHPTSSNPLSRFLLFLCRPVLAVALRWTDHASMEPYQVLSSKDYALAVLHTSQITIGHTRYSQFVRVFTNRCLVAASNVGPSPFSGFSNCPRPQSNSSQRLNHTSPLTNSLLTCPAYNVSARTTQKTPFLCCCLRAAA